MRFMGSSFELYRWPQRTAGDRAATRSPILSSAYTTVLGAFSKANQLPLFVCTELLLAQAEGSHQALHRRGLRDHQRPHLLGRAGDDRSAVLDQASHELIVARGPDEFRVELLHDGGRGSRRRCQAEPVRDLLVAKAGLSQGRDTGQRGPALLGVERDRAKLLLGKERS